MPVAKLLTALLMLILVQDCVFGQGSYSSRRRTGYPSHSNAAYSLYKTPYSASSRKSKLVASRSQNYPAGSLKRTVYTGRYCSYPAYKNVTQTVLNGTETYLRKVVTNCHWRSLYCNPKVSYVTSSRRTYRTVTKQLRTDEWRCCPGFFGEKCESECYNCTVIEGFRQRIAELEGGTGTSDHQGNPAPLVGTKGEPGDTGPPGVPGIRGQPGDRGQRGYRGPKGDTGIIGPPGAVGPLGAPGMIGPHGPPGSPGIDGMNGMDGVPGVPGIQGPPGPEGKPGISGLDGLDGRTGEDGVPGVPGRDGEDGLPGKDGARGEQGPPGKPGVCECSTATPPPEEKPSCIENGTTYQEGSLWKRGNCEECMCVVGETICFDINCPSPLRDCKYKYTAEGDCCAKCCPYQPEDSDYGSGYEASAVGDGSDETIVDSEAGDDFYETENYTNFITVDINHLTDALGCPIAAPMSRIAASGWDIPDHCKLEKYTGPCRGSFSRFYFDPKKSECLEFVYGGCDKNRNNFESKVACLKECKPGYMDTKSPAGMLSEDTNGPKINFAAEIAKNKAEIARLNKQMTSLQQRVLDLEKSLLVQLSNSLLVKDELPDEADLIKEEYSNYNYEIPSLYPGDSGEYGNIYTDLEDDTDS